MHVDYFLSHQGLTIPCKCSQSGQSNVQRIVLGVHGLGGCAEDQIQASIAEEMELFGSAVFRFDFPAHGASPAGSEDFTVENCVQSLLAVAGDARQRYPLVEDLCIFATGFGAYITLVALPQLLKLPGRVKLVVQTPSVRMHETLLNMANLSRETLWAMEHYTFQSPRPFSVSYKLYEELMANIVLTSYSIPMLILHGQEDDFIRMDDILHLRRLNEDAKLVIIPGTSHRFMESGAWDMVLDLTRDWFEFEQVLLTDWL